MTDVIGGVILMAGGVVMQLSSLASLRQARPARGPTIAAVLPYTPTPRRDPYLDALMLRAAAALDAD